MDLNILAQPQQSNKRHQRKRTRHRSRHGQRSSFDANHTRSESTLSSWTNSNIDMTFSDRSSSVASSNGHRVRNTIRDMNIQEEDPKARNKRVFGGEDDEAGSTELCGPMLDVVLGLFGKIDYDDSM